MKVTWTNKIIKDISPWFWREEDQTGHHLTQFLSRHGAFGSYVHRIGKRNRNVCKYCDDEEDDIRQKLIQVETILQITIKEEKVIAGTIEDIMKIKEFEQT